MRRLLAAVTSPAGQTWQLSYLPDLPGLLASFTRPGGGTSTFQWDSSGRLLQDAGPEGGFTALQHERWASERADRGTHVTAEGRIGEAALTQPISGSTYKSVLRSDGRTTSLTILRDGHQNSTSSIGESWQLSYAPDPRFGAAAMIPASMQYKASAGGLDYVSTTTFERFGTPAVPDADLGQIDLLEMTTINGRLAQRSYDSTGRTWTFTSPSGRIVTQSMDARSRPLITAVPGLAPVAQLRYDAAARPTQLASDSGVTLAFDWLGTRPLAQTWSGPVAGRVTRRYDRTPQGISNFWLAGLTLRIGNTDYPTDYAYDLDGLLTGASANGKTLTLAREAQNGRLTGTSVSSLTDSWTTNPFAEPTGYVAKFNDAPVFETSYLRDKLGRITQKTETTNGQNRTDVYGYDLAGRLESITRDGVPLVSCTYDGNSNRIAATTENGTINGSVDARASSSSRDRQSGVGLRLRL